MLNTNIDWYEKLAAEQVWNEIDPNYSIDAGSIVYRSVTSEHVVMISKMVGCDDWCCEIESVDDSDLEAQGFGNTPENALAAAIIECVGYDVLREEDNCEDASNVITREAYVFAYGDVPMFQMFADIEIVDWLMGAACEFVKKNCERYGIEWE